MIKSAAGSCDVPLCRSSSPRPKEIQCNLQQARMSYFDGKFELTEGSPAPYSIQLAVVLCWRGRITALCGANRGILMRAKIVSPTSHNCGVSVILFILLAFLERN